MFLIFNCHSCEDQATDLAYCPVENAEMSLVKVKLWNCWPWDESAAGAAATTDAAALQESLMASEIEKNKTTKRR